MNQRNLESSLSTLLIARPNGIASKDKFLRTDPEDEPNSLPYDATSYSFGS